MSLLLAGQLAAVALACGLNLYLTVATLGLLARLDIIQTLPPGLTGLQGTIVIGTAGALFLVEAVVDKIGHADSLWDTVHTFIRPPAAALLAVAALWGLPLDITAILASAAFLVALAAHGTKAGIRIAMNAGQRRGHAWVSLAEDLLAAALAATAFLDPGMAMLGAGVILLALLLIGPRYWRAFRLGLRALSAWVRTLFRPGGWREGPELPRRVRALLDPLPLGGAPPRGARGAMVGMPGIGAYRNGWLVVSATGTLFVYATALGFRRADLPAPVEVHVEPGVWVNALVLSPEPDRSFRFYMLKDGPPLDLTIPHLQGTAP